MNARVTNLDGALMPMSGVMQNLTVGGTAVQLGSLPDGCKSVFFTCDAGDIRFTIDGTTPVAGTTGHLMKQDSSGTWSRAVAAAAKFVSEGGGNVYLRASPAEG
jgi:hypothetical protein